MLVRLSSSAEDDLENIGDYIAREDPRSAVEHVRVLKAKCMDLAYFPRRFALVAGQEPEGVRRRVHGNYVILYRIDDAAVVILHIVHGARDYGRLL